jgi:hypothetical protein
MDPSSLSYVPLTLPLSPILGERRKARGDAGISIRMMYFFRNM